MYRQYETCHRMVGEQPKGTGSARYPSTQLTPDRTQMTLNVTALILKVVCDTPTRDVGHLPSPARMRQSPTRQGPRGKGVTRLRIMG
jgi:hypothetical protein